MKTIKETDFKPENLGRCECGNYTHIAYLKTDRDGYSSCPRCQFEYMKEQIINLKKLVYECGDTHLSKNDLKNMIMDKYRKIYDIDEADDDFFEAIGI